MEPQTEIPNPPEQNQAEPPKDSLLDITLPRYWLATLLPVLGIFAGWWATSFLPWDWHDERWISIIYDILYYFMPMLFGVAISFVVNFFLPFLTNKRRFIYSGILLMLIWILMFCIIAFIAIGFVWESYMTLLLIVNFLYVPLILFFGWLGAKAGIAHGREA